NEVGEGHLELHVTIELFKHFLWPWEHMKMHLVRAWRPRVGISPIRRDSFLCHQRQGVGHAPASALNLGHTKTNILNKIHIVCLVSSRPQELPPHFLGPFSRMH